MDILPGKFNTDYTLVAMEKENRYVVISGENFFAVNKLVYHILNDIKANLSLPEITVRLAALFPNICISANSVANILSSKELSQIFNPGKTESPLNNGYIWFKVNILHPETISSLLKFLGILFSEKLYKWLITISGIITLIMIIKVVLIEKNFPYINTSPFTVLDIALVFIISQIIVFFHEIGHATAGYKNNVTSKSIGFGLYFIFPVLYTELSEIWRLPRSKRIQVNMAGMYFQLLINVLLIAGFYIANKPTFILASFVMNTVSVLVSFNPFFRYDGYWILSDLLCIPNLRARSNACISALLTKMKTPSLKLQETPGYPLAIYSLLNLVFWAWVYFKLVAYFIVTLQQFITEINTGAIGLSVISKGIVLLIILVFILTTLLKKQTWTRFNT